MPRFSEHELSGAFGMLKAGVRVSDVNYTAHQRSLPGCWDIKDRRRSDQPNMATDVKSQVTSFVYRRYLHQRYPFRLVLSVPDE